MTVEQVLDLILAKTNKDAGLFQMFIKQNLGGRELHSSKWSTLTFPCGAEARKMSLNYVMPTPADIPDVAKRIVALPETVLATVVTWLESHDDQELIVMQRSMTHGIMYCDRFHIEYCYSFAADPVGGVLVRQWVDVVWRKALPWTHAFLGRVLEKRVKTESASLGEDLIRLLQDLGSNSF